MRLLKQRRLQCLASLKERSLFFVMFIHDILILSRNKWFQLLFRYYSVKYMDNPSCTTAILQSCYHLYCYAVTIQFFKSETIWFPFSDQAPVGSSARRIEGFVTIALAIATRLLPHKAGLADCAFYPKAQPVQESP